MCSFPLCASAWWYCACAICSFIRIVCIFVAMVVDIKNLVGLKPQQSIFKQRAADNELHRRAKLLFPYNNPHTFHGIAKLFHLGFNCNRTSESKHMTGRSGTLKLFRIINWYMLPFNYLCGSVDPDRPLDTLTFEIPKFYMHWNKPGQNSSVINTF
jgi:hypothetical protein